MTKSQRAKIVNEICELSGFAAWEVIDDLDCLNDQDALVMLADLRAPSVSDLNKQPGGEV